MRRISLILFWFSILIMSFIVVSCVKETYQQPQHQEELHEVVFHAGWEPETKTVLQEDGSVWWSPEDEIGLFVETPSRHAFYKLTATNTEPAPRTDFIGQIEGEQDAISYLAIYPYNSATMYNGYSFKTTMPLTQIAREGTFDKGYLVSAAVSEDNHLYFHNLCGGIVFSVENEGINKITIKANAGELIAGTIAINKNLEIVADSQIGEYLKDYSSMLEVVAPNEGAFIPGKHYYAVIPAMTLNQGLSVTYYKGDKAGTYEYRQPIEIKRGVFKRLYGKDKDVIYHTCYQNVAELYSFLPKSIDKTSITEIHFHVNDATVTENQLAASVPVYYEVEGTSVNIYTSAEVFDISRVTANMFNGYFALQELDLSKTIVSNAVTFFRMFMDCRSLESILFGDWDTHEVQSMVGMFDKCEKLRSLDLSFMDTSNLEEMPSFGDCKSLTSLNISSFDTSHITEMRGLFAGLRALKSLDLSSFNTSNVTDMSAMFGSCSSLESLDLSGFNTANVTSMQSMFDNCESLKTINLSSFNTSNVESFEGMFYGCSNLESLDLKNFSTSKAKSMHFMFGWCTFLKDLDVSSFTSESLQRATYMFGTCKRLQRLNLGEFDVSQVENQYFGEAVMRTSKSGAIRCIPETKAILEQTMDENLIDKVTWLPLSDDINTFEYQRDPNLYYSSDFSKHETVKKLYSATKGNGIDIVLMGDAYSDRMIANGQYDADMELAADAIFAKEPMASFKDLFNVYIVYLVSDNEVIGESTALNAVEGGPLSVTAQIPEKYRILATGNGDLSAQEVIVIVNGTSYTSGYATLSARFEDNNYYDCDYGWGYSSAVVARGDHDYSDEYQITVAHEFGHSFAKLADEYVTNDTMIGEYDASVLADHFNRFGWYKNVDLSSDPAIIRWSRFLSDERYADDGVGIFEGGALYAHGVWRPSENSIMNNGTMFNAPSRAAIYNRIHKLAYGKDWQFDWEEFVQWDTKNIGLEKHAINSYHPHVKHKPFISAKESINKDGKVEINVIMN